jgi:hypothetical protein
MKVINYTAMIGDRDKPREDILCFNSYNKFQRPVMNAKIYKILPHQYLDCDVSVWTDANITLKVPPEELVDEWMEDYDMVLWKHFGRDCIYDEAAVIIQFGDTVFGKDVASEVFEQSKEYMQRGFPRKSGLAECNVILRKHNKEMEEFNNAWWSEICRWSSRDQISFPYVLSKFPNLKVKFIFGNPRNHEYFEYKTHEK